MFYKILKMLQKIYNNLSYSLSRFVLKGLGVKIGKNLKTLPITTIENPSGIKIGDNVWISKNVALYGCNGINIGSDVIIAKDVSIISGDHNFSNKNLPINKQGMRTCSAPVTIGDDVWIGEKAIILKSVNVGKGCVIGAGAVITKSVAPYSIVAGNPAVIIKKRDKS